MAAEDYFPIDTFDDNYYWGGGFDNRSELLVFGQSSRAHDVQVQILPMAVGF